MHGFCYCYSDESNEHSRTLPRFLFLSGRINTQKQTLLRGWWCLRLWGNMLKKMQIQSMSGNKGSRDKRRKVRCIESVSEQGRHEQGRSLSGFHLRPVCCRGSCHRSTQGPSILGSLKSKPAGWIGSAAVGSWTCYFLSLWPDALTKRDLELVYSVTVSSLLLISSHTSLGDCLVASDSIPPLERSQK